MPSTWTIRPRSGPPGPERLTAAEQKAVHKETGVLLQRPGVPGAIVSDPSGAAVLAISDASEIRNIGTSAATSTAEVLVPAPAGEPWPATGRIRHDNLAWTHWQHESLDGDLLGSGDAPTGRGREWGLFGGATLTVCGGTYLLEDLIRPESDDERARRERKRFFKGEKLAGRALGHRFLAADGTEAGRLTWVGEHQPEHHERPYDWRFEWVADRPDDAVLVGATACALRFMAYVGSMLSTS